MAKFKRGESGNPGGRPKADPEVREILRAGTADAARELVKMSQGKRNTHLKLKACLALLEWDIGKAKQEMQHSGELNLKTDEFEKMSTAELLERARELGVKVKSKA